MGSEDNASRRRLRIEIPGQSAILLRSLHIVEAMSRPFHVQASIVAEQPNISAADLLGKPATITILDMALQPRRTFTGIMSSVRYCEAVRDEDWAVGLHPYDIEIVPKMARLAWQSNCRVFQDSSVIDIVGELASSIQMDRPGAGSTPTEKRPYCIQFNETDYDFMQRLLDSIGCGYYWRHEDSEIQIAHAAGDYLLLPGMPDGGYVRSSVTADRSLLKWSSRRLADSGGSTALDYDLRRPNALLRGAATTLIADLQNQTQHERFTWPGGQFLQPEQLAHPSRLTIERIEAATETAQAFGHDPGLAPGYRVRVCNAPDDAASEDWLVLSVVHSAFDETFLTQGAGAAYSNAVTLQPASRPFRPQRVQPKPIVPGVQSAIVVGPASQEIHTDELGRIKIRFLWDRSGAMDENACTIWVRVAQAAAGHWGGTFFLPRVGDEVLVAFTDGDPDKPVVIGSLYNDEAPVDAEHFRREGANPMSGLRTRSTKEGRSDNGHVIRFNDTKSSEELYIQSERDMKLLVKNARTETINAGDLSGDDTYLIARGNRNITVAEGNYKLDVQKGDLVEEVGAGNHTLTVKKGNETLEVGQGDYGVTVSKGAVAFKVSLGDMSITCDAGAVKIEAVQAITLKCGQSTVKIDPSGVTINGVLVKIEGTASASLQSPMTTAGGSGMTNVTGAAIMIG